jgi:uncharacterized protein YgfB (UPF0149 family)
MEPKEIIETFAKAVVKFSNDIAQSNKAKDLARAFSNAATVIGDNDTVTIPDIEDKPFVTNAKAFEGLATYFDNFLLETSVARISLQKQSDALSQMNEWGQIPNEEMENLEDAQKAWEQIKEKTKQEKQSNPKVKR